MEPIILPQFTHTSPEATIVRWLCEEGEYVRVGDELLEVLIDSETYTVVAETEGFLIDIYYHAGDAVSLDERIAAIYSAEEIQQDGVG